MTTYQPAQPARNGPAATAVRLIALAALLIGCLVTGAAAGVQPAHAAAPVCGVLAPGAAPQAQAAVTQACGLLGTPYSWSGGHGPTPGPTLGVCDPANGAPNDCNVVGLDCSGMVRYAYDLAVGTDVVPGPTWEQIQNAGQVAHFYASDGTAPLLPGDLVFFGTTAAGVHHVAIYLGQGYIVESPYSGGYVQVAPMSSHSDYYAAVRLYPGTAATSVHYWADTAPNAPVYASATSTAQTGTLYAGTNYVYCKVWGRMIGNSSVYNHWWLRTDPDVGPAGQYVSAYYLTLWGNDQADDNNGIVIPNC
ncbi:C40 family peptidase [Streptacidiphilus cavernicola]|uniref:C40 family peptidase n=1 Tax=Streptacidiphilus cavernicola TaxID=3342716 RepID=A0ABV6VW47_9ACTN